MSEILLSIDSFQIRQVNELLTELETLCKENNLSKEETKLTMLNMFKSAYPTYEYETADKIERARLVEKIYKNIDNIKTNLNSFLYKKEEELAEVEAIASEANADNMVEAEATAETPTPQTEPENQAPLDHSSYLILPTRLLEALLKTAGNKKDNPHRMHLQSIGISTKNKMIFSTNGRIYLGLYDVDFSNEIENSDKILNPNPHLLMPDVLLYAEDVKIFLKSLKTLATEDKKVDKNLCLLKYTPANLDEDLPTLTLYSSNRALKKEVLAFNDDDTSFMTYKFSEVCLNVDYINEHIVNNNDADAILDINYLTTLLDAYKKLTLNEYLDFSKFFLVEDKETDFKGKHYHDADHNLIAGIACVRK